MRKAWERKARNLTALAGVTISLRLGSSLCLRNSSHFALRGLVGRNTIYAPLE